MKDLLDPNTKILHSSNKKEIDLLKISLKGLKKKVIRVSSVGENECLGLIEGFVDCPYSFVTITCTSEDAVVHKIKKNDMNIKLDYRTTALIMQNLKDKLSLFCQRIQQTSPDIEISPSYYKTDMKLQYKVEEELPAKSKKVERAPKEEELNSSDDHLQVHKYVSMVMPKNKFKIGVKKAIQMNKFKNVVNETEVKAYLAATPSSVPRSARPRPVSKTFRSGMEAARETSAENSNLKSDFSKDSDVSDDSSDSVKKDERKVLFESNGSDISGRFCRFINI